MRVAIYLRVSTKDKGQDVANQREQLIHYTDSIVEVENKDHIYLYEDAASGSTSDRPQFRKLFEDARQRKFDLVLFWSLDRFSREGVLATLKHLERLTSYGVNWRSYTEQYLDSCGVFKDAVLSILATIAKQERIRIQERTIAGLARAKREGKTLGRPKRIVNSDKIQMLLFEGLSYTAIAKLLGVSRSVVYRRAKGVIQNGPTQDPTQPNPTL